MGKKDAGKREDRPVSPKRLRGQLRKADARLARARDKRDRAQARVEALAIIADEIRATLAEVEKAAAPAAANAAAEPAAAKASREAAAKAPRQAAARAAATSGAAKAPGASAVKPTASPRARRRSLSPPA